MPDKKIVETLELIATRVPPGDRWRLVSDSRNIIHPSIMEVLETYFVTTKFKGDYRFSPSESKLYIIKTTEEEIIPEPPKTYNIYGEPE